MILALNLLLLLSGNNCLILIIKKSLTYYLIVAFFTLLSLDGLSQSDSIETHSINGKQYYIHIVEKGESLYAIHKKYDIPVDVIKKENPGVSDGLSIGEKVFIPVKRETNSTNTINGNFITHEVQKKQTLYSISKLYKVQQNEIIAANPQLTEGLKEGQIIKIPVKKLKIETISDDTEVVQKKKTHNVSKGETLYSLSKIYGVSVDEIKAENNGLPQGLQEGETIIIPTNDTDLNQDTLSNTSADTIIVFSDSIFKKKTYNIGLLLPFYLDENDEMVEKRSALEERKIYPRSQFAIEFYNGFLKALDSIYDDSCQFKVFAYDTHGDDTTRIKNLIAKPIFKELDLIVGPLYYSNFSIVAEFAKQNKIPLITPVKQNNKVLLGNAYLFKVIPSKTAMIDPISKLLVDSFKTENLLALSYKEAKEKALIELYVNAYNKKVLENADTNIYSSIKTIEVTSNLGDVVANLKLNQNNVIFVPTSDQSTVTNLFSYLITTLNKRNYKDYKVTLIGLEEWMDFTNIDMEYFQRLNVHYSTAQYINEEDSLTNHFIENYIEEKNVYPDKNALLGFDIGYYFANYFNNYGAIISPNYLSSYQGKSIKIDFFKTGIESGYENNSINLLYFNDYILKKLE